MNNLIRNINSYYNLNLKIEEVNKLHFRYNVKNVNNIEELKKDTESTFKNILNYLEIEYKVIKVTVLNNKIHIRVFQ